MSGDPATAVFSLAWRQTRRGAAIWGAMFAAVVVSSILGYATAFPTAAERLQLAASTAGNTGLQGLFGQARSLDTVQGFVAWRSGGFIPLIVAVWALLAATRLLRGEEEGGRWELLVSGPTTPAAACAATLAALGAANVLIFAAIALVTAVAGASHGIGVGAAAYFGLAMSVAGLVFGALGALASQLCGTRRQAVALATGIFGAAVILRVVADSSSSAHWLAWLTPLGWVEELHPLTAANPAALVPIALATAVLSAVTVRIAARRDIGDAAISAPAHADADLRLLGSPGQHALRTVRGSVIGWSLGLGLAAFIFALVSKGVIQAAGSALRHEGGRLGQIGTAEGYIGLTFMFIILALSLYAASLVAHVREEESSGRLDELLAQPLTRGAWLTGRLAVAAIALAMGALAAGLAGWVGSVAGSAGAGIGVMLEAALNTMPPAVLFLGLATLAYGFAPRETTTLGYGVVMATFLISMIGETLRAPAWVLDISPFHYLALVPGTSINVGAAVGMVVLGLAAVGAGLYGFERRDLASA